MGGLFNARRSLPPTRTLLRGDRSENQLALLLAGNLTFTPVLAKHSKSFSLIDCISVGVDRMQGNFEPMRKQVEGWQRSELTDVTARVVIYEAFDACALCAGMDTQSSLFE
jgi:hypothetical protein